MENQIPDVTKHERFQRLVAVINESSFKCNKKYEGEIVQVLVEGKSKNNANMLTGKTRTGKTVNFEGKDDLYGQLVNVKIEEALSFSLNGIALQGE